ncbi:DUF6318 family protein [Arcanobacterium buesumense]|uniref:DUF6318 domain-containing protein n=1 Tax=Arcanobacterium buesumense TaxID=2722751 RepID=A0A6H2EJX0_9ACTO|nr:DUF6318 family protein [Arcanobacterium buesumense]QJC21636.1 hypothetical protein HC352_03360 [Arcanobacterium buesumense]
MGEKAAKSIFCKVWKGLVLVSSCVVLASCVSADMKPESQLEKDREIVAEQHIIPPRPILDRPAEPELTGDSRTDAVAVAQHFVTFYPYMLKTGDTSYWEKHSAPECEFCQKVLAASKARNETGAWIDGEMRIIDQVNGIVDEEKDKYEIQFLIERTHVVEYGESDERENDRQYHVVISLEKNNSWSVKQFQIGNPSGFKGKIG